MNIANAGRFTHLTAKLCKKRTNPLINQGVVPQSIDIANAGIFTHQLAVDFSVLPNSAAMPNGLVASDEYYIGASGAYGKPHMYTNKMVTIKNRSMQLKVLGGQTLDPAYGYSGAQVTTQIKNILYGSVKTVAKLSKVTGVCHGFFYYANDNSEVDIEILTDDMTGIHYTNQPLTAAGPETTEVGSIPDDATTAYHEYRIDWIPGATFFYLDGKLQKKLTTSVPSTPGSWMWNNWFNGNPGWSGGPPLADSILHIRSITMAFNTTDSAH